MPYPVADTKSRIVDHARRTGRFTSVAGHEPKNAPAGNGVSCSVWNSDTKAVRASGLNRVSILVVYKIRLMLSVEYQPADDIDDLLSDAASVLCAAYSGDFALGDATSEDVRAIDILGAAGDPLGWEFGYLEMQGPVFRVCTITMSVIMNDAWDLAS